MSELHPFIFEGLPVRGALVRLINDWQEVLARHQRYQMPDEAQERESQGYHARVGSFLGEMTAAAVLLQHNIQFDGAFLLQIQGGQQKSTSPIKLAVVEVEADLGFRSTAKVVHALDGSESFHQLVNADNQARCAITLVPRKKHEGRQMYQSMVALNDHQGIGFSSLAQTLEHYMLQSEQLHTKIVLAANQEVAVGVLIQRMPIEGEKNLGAKAARDPITGAPLSDEDFHRLATLTASLTAEEMLQLSADDILHRLFWNEPLMRYAPRDPAPQFRCQCSVERVANAIRSLGQEEARRTLESQGGCIRVNCDFCGQPYLFDAVDAESLFVSPTALAPAHKS